MTRNLALDGATTSAEEDLVRRRLRRDPGGDVHRPAEVVALVVDHRSRATPMCAGEPAEYGVTISSEAHRVRVAEVEVNPVPEHLHDRARWRSASSMTSCASSSGTRAATRRPRVGQAR
jgi:hypothetical protein